MKANQDPRQPPIDWPMRIGLARSILNHREPCEITGVLAYKALEGHSVEALLRRERVLRETRGGAA